LRNAGHCPICWPQLLPTRPMSSSPIFGCPQATRTKGSRRPSSSDAAIRTSRWWVLSQYVDAEYALAVVEDGSAGRGYLLKERISDAIPLVAAIRAVAAGDSVIDPRVVDAVMGRDPVARVPGLDRLTARETEVMQCIAAGQSNAAIAAVLSVTDRAVEKHINSIFSKLDLPDPTQVHRRVAAVLVFLSRPPSSLRRSGRRPVARR
jgi:DNA-binding NarL/FixJ family response regulator